MYSNLLPNLITILSAQLLIKHLYNYLYILACLILWVKPFTVKGFSVRRHTQVFLDMLSCLTFRLKAFAIKGFHVLYFPRLTPIFRKLCCTTFAANPNTVNGYRPLRLSKVGHPKTLYNTVVFSGEKMVLAASIKLAPACNKPPYYCVIPPNKTLFNYMRHYTALPNYKKRLQKWIIVIALLGYFNPLSAQQQKIEELTKQYGIPGIQLVCIKGNKEESLNLGKISNSSNKNVTANTIFEAASLSKCVFAYTVLRLYDKGIINLDTPLLKYVGAYERFDSTDTRYAKISARMVLRHTTGLPNWGDDKVAKLLFTPDSAFSYSGEGFQYLQRAVEKLTGKTLDEVAQQEVFTPLVMASSSYTWSAKFDTLSAFGSSADAVSGHTTQKAAASLLTCAHDYAIFLRALMAGTGLKPATHRMMFSKQSGGIWFNHRATEANNHIWWGLGMGLQENETGRWAWQWGDNGDFKGFCILNPSKNEALVYFTHSNWGLHITTDIFNAYFPHQTWWPLLWIGYEFYEKKNMLAFWAQLDKTGYDHTLNIAHDLKQKDTSFLLPESDVSDLAFILLGKKMKNEAIDIFKYNLAEHPNSADSYEGLAEGYDDMGEKQLAIENFKKSVELNPNNNYAVGRIKKLEGK